MKILVTIVLFASVAFAQSQSGNAQFGQRPGNSSVAEQRIDREARHELFTLPRYNLFDDIEYRVDGNTVTLLGDVTDPVVKSDAEKAVKKIEGVEQVRNQINVLPLSIMDEQLRGSIARALFNAGGLSEYFYELQPSIRIIVANGDVTLKGFVNNKGDRDLAEITVHGVPGVFSVNNQLQVTPE